MAKAGDGWGWLAKFRFWAVVGFEEGQSRGESFRWVGTLLNSTQK